MTFNTSVTTPFGNTLIVGAGPAAINIAVNISGGWCGKLGLVNRAGARTNRLKEDFKKSGQVLYASYQSPSTRHLSGKARVDYFYDDFQKVTDQWETLILCTPSDSYLEVIKSLALKKFKKTKTLILLSPGIGSNLLLERHFKEEMERIDLISFSSYYAATKYERSEEEGAATLTKALKKRIYLASSKKHSMYLKHVSEFIESLGVQCQIVATPIEAESKSVTTYVHPPLFMNSFAMKQILRKERSLKWMYKIYPEGPITQHVIRAMVRLWKEISAVVEYFGAQPINLLQFLNDDNYPVHEKTLSREDIDLYHSFSEEKQEYLLYIRYSAILIDPFAIPDEKGKYFDFSAVPFKRAEINSAGKWIIPRIPLEDYQKLKLIYELAQSAGIQMPQALSLLQTFEREVNQFSTENQVDFSNYHPAIDGLSKKLVDLQPGRGEVQ